MRRSKTRKWTKCLDVDKECGWEKEKGAGWPDLLQSRDTGGTPTIYLPSHTPKLSTTSIQKKAIKTAWFKVTKKRANTDGAFTTERGRTRLNEITAKIRHLQCFAAYKATVMFLTWIFVFFVIFVHCCWNWNILSMAPWVNHISRKAILKVLLICSSRTNFLIHYPTWWTYYVYNWH